MATKFHVQNAFHGYRNLEDRTNLKEGTLVKGSQNVLLNVGDRVQLRPGYTLDGQSNAALTPIESSCDWERHLGDERHLRAYGTELEYRYVDAAGVITWRTLLTGTTSAKFNFAEFWDVNEQEDVLLFVNGQPSITEWNGSIATFQSATVNTITKQGVTTWGDLGFYVTGNKKIVINGTTYTYTGGETTTTLTGVTPDPSIPGYTPGTVIHQLPVTTLNSAMTAIPLQHNDLIDVLYNQIYIGDFQNRREYVSKQNNYKDYSFANPRKPGEGAIFTLDGTPVGFETQEDAMYITAGKGQWYKTQFQYSSDLLAQTLEIQRLKSNPRGAAQSQALIFKIKNDVVFVSNEPVLDTLGRLNQINVPQSVNLSNPIKLDFDLYNFKGGANGGSTYYFQNNIYIAIPANNTVLIYNLTKNFWNPPQILPISRFAVIDGELYGHSSQVPETYKMFTGLNDNGGPIDGRALFAYQQYGDRANSKNAVSSYHEGYIAGNTKLTTSLSYNYLGCEGVQNNVIDGSDPTMVCNTGSDGSLGKQSLGKRSLAGRGATIDESLPPKYRTIFTFPPLDWYEIQVEYSSDAIDQQWEILAYGISAKPSLSENNAISH